MVRYVAIGFGCVLIVLGILGWIPAVAPDGRLFGLFATGTLYNVFHIVTGLVALIVGFTTQRAARHMFQFLGVVYLIVAALGFFAGDRLDVLEASLADHVLHAVMALFALCIGFLPTPEHRYAQPNTRMAAESRQPRGI